MFDRDGYTLMVASVALAVLAFVAALRFRSWPLWLTALALTIAALCVAWSLREPVRTGLLVLADAATA
jgi:hypothetical protein